MHRMNMLFALAGVVSLTLFVLTVRKDSNREWKRYQKMFNQLEYDRANSEELRISIKNRKLKIEQIVLEDLDRVDRCTSCHLAVERAGTYSDHPFKSHPDPLQHPFEKFGCTVCHHGQGRATTSEAAHGNVEHWHEPLLVDEYIQGSCGKCHQDEVEEAPLLTLGRELYKEYECSECHKISGSGENLGPDLTNIGSKRNPEWLFKFLKTPELVNPETEMPDFGLTDEETKALTIYMMSLTSENIPIEYTIRR